MELRGRTAVDLGEEPPGALRPQSAPPGASAAPDSALAALTLDRIDA